jgi:cyclopropane fatty-acyl-phospholipid synthase-like methyltransferase
MPSKSKKSGKKKRPTMAERAELHSLYEDAVQCVEAEIDFVDETYKKLRRRKAQWLREDFCGTASAACEWVRRRRTNQAIGVDLDAGVQQWGRDHRVAELKTKEQERIELIHADVMDVECHKVDIVLAMNFSYWFFKTRERLRTYFSHVREGLNDDGLFMLDAYGGPDAHRELEEKTKMTRFTYIWDQHSYNPITADLICYIHFAFPDGSRIRKAFTYDWRLWTLPEIREILLEAGFRNAAVYWEGTNEKTNEGNGEYTATDQGEADDAFVVYIVAEK